MSKTKTKHILERGSWGWYTHLVVKLLGTRARYYSILIHPNLVLETESGQSVTELSSHLHKLCKLRIRDLYIMEWCSEAKSHLHFALNVS
jgi:hypothetical protein